LKNPLHWPWRIAPEKHIGWLRGESIMGAKPNSWSILLARAAGQVTIATRK
jgi:hypothetical protein